MGSHKVFDESRVPYYEGSPFLPSQLATDREYRREEMLAAAIIEKAISDLECSDPRTRIFRDALRWFERDVDEDYNFTLLAQSLGIDPSAVRRVIQGRYGKSSDYAGMIEIGGLSDVRSMKDRARFADLGITPTKTKRGISIHSHKGKQGGRCALTAAVKTD